MYKAAVIGCGRVGCGFDDDPKRQVISTHAKAYSSIEKVRLVALCDIDKEKLAKYGKKYAVANTYTDYKKMFAEQKLDLVSICTLAPSHLELVEAASNSGVRGIFCEKPISDSLEHAKSIIDICEKNNTVLIIDHQRRFDPLFSVIKKLIDDGIFGDIHHTVFHYTAGIFNTGTHAIDLMRYFFGDVEWIIGKFSSCLSSNSTDPNIDGVLKFKNGVHASVHASNVEDYLIFEEDILGSKGRLRILHSGFEIEYYGIFDSRYFSGYKELERTSLPFDIPQKREYMIEGVNHLIDCVENKTVPVSSGSDGLKALQIILTLIESAKNSSKKIYLVT